MFTSKFRLSSEAESGTKYVKGDADRRKTDYHHGPLNLGKPMLIMECVADEATINVDNHR